MPHRLHRPQYLLPDPELLIRTAGEMRTSNFLIWQAAGALFWSTPVFWPDFTRQHLLQAIAAWRSARPNTNNVEEVMPLH